MEIYDELLLISSICLIFLLNIKMFLKNRQFKKIMKKDTELYGEWLAAVEQDDRIRATLIRQAIDVNLSKMREMI